MEAGFVDILMIVIGAVMAVCAFGGAMTDGATPKWTGPAFVAGVALALAGFVLLGAKIVAFAASFWTGAAP